MAILNDSRCPRRAAAAALLLLVLWTTPGRELRSQEADRLLERARAAVAPITGRIAVAGLQRPVEVLRDRWGIAHIYAENQDDLFFAQGFVAAQDRLFQIDMW